MRLPALRHLAGRVARRERRQPSRVERIRRTVGFARKPRDAEVEDLRGAFAGGERVTRLEIAVHDAARVCVGEPGGEPADDPACALRRDAARLGPDQCVERHPVEQLHGDKRLARVRIHVERVDRGDVGMCERARLAGFALQRDVGILVTLHVAGQELDRHMRARIPCLLEQEVLRLPYLAHGAGAQQLFEAIAAPDQVAGAGRNRGASRYRGFCGSCTARNRWRGRITTCGVCGARAIHSGLPVAGPISRHAVVGSVAATNQGSRRIHAKTPCLPAWPSPQARRSRQPPRRRATRSCR